MKNKLFTLLVTLTLGCSSTLFAADRDLGGMVITIATYNDLVEPEEKLSTYEEILWEYRNELMDTYNFTLEYKGLGKWDTMLELLSTSTLAGEAAAEIFRLDPRYAAPAINSGLCYDLTTLSTIDVYDDKWVDNMTEMMTVGKSVYGVIDQTNSGVRKGIFFNKRLFEEAGLDSDLLYDLQASGDWTWAKFEELSAKLTRDTNNDGVNDVYGFAMNHSSFFSMAVLSNGATYINRDENGLYYNDLSSLKAMEALVWAAEYGKKDYEYFPTKWNAQPEAFESGKAAMMIGDNWQTASFADMADDWGYVTFPKGPKSETNTVTSNDTAWIIPSSFSKSEAEDIAFVLDLWMTPPPGYDGEEDWMITLYPNYRDDRAVDETQVMAREPGVSKIGFDHVISAATNINAIATQIYINGKTPAEAVEALSPIWQAELNKVNQLQKK